MNLNKLYYLLIFIVFFGCEKNKKIDNEECYLPEDYGLVSFVQPPHLVEWHPYKGIDSIVFVREDGLKKSFGIIISDTIQYSPLTCYTPCPNNPEEWGWINYTSQYVSVNLLSSENVNLDLSESIPSKISINLSSTLLFYDDKGNADFISIDIHSSLVTVTNTGLTSNFAVSGLFPHDLNGNVGLDQNYKFISFIEFSGEGYNNIYESSCADCDDTGKIYFSKEQGIIAFKGKDQLFWYLAK